MTKLEDRLDEVERMFLELSTAKIPDDSEHTRPPVITAWCVESEEDRWITVLIGQQWGASDRFIEFTPAEARKLASELVRLADSVDAIRRDDNEDDDEDNDD